MGIGVRVPMLVVSPFSAEGGCARTTFDHTSQLQFLAERFGVPIPNMSAWRLNTVGDLTTTLPKLSSPDTRIPSLPKVTNTINNPPVDTECTGADLIELDIGEIALPPPATQVMPTQDGTVLTRIS